jgi:DNA-binding phage protein
MNKQPDQRTNLTASYREYLLTTLRDPQEAAGYLNAVLAEGDPAAFELALRDVAEAHGLAELTAETPADPANSPLTVSHSQPLANVTALLDALGMQLMVGAKRAA